MPANTESLIPATITDSLPSMVRNELVKMSAHKQEEFIEEYKRRQKQLGWAYVCWLFGIFAFHYGYMGNWGTQFAYWFTLGGVGIWWLIDAARMPQIVNNYNKDLAVDLLRSMKTIG